MQIKTGNLQSIYPTNSFHVKAELKYMSENLALEVLYTR
jgi:hypothetical protein